MHRFFAFLIPLAVLILQAPRGTWPSTAKPGPSALYVLLEQLDAVQGGHDRDKIVQACNAILLVQPTYHRAQLMLAAMHFTRKEYRKAAADYARVLLSYPHDEAALSGAMWSAIRIGDLDRAKQDATTLLRLNPAYPNAQLGYDVATGRCDDPVPLAGK